MKIDRSTLCPFDFEGLGIVDYTAGRDLSSSIAEIIVPPGVRHRRAWSNRSDKYYIVLEGQLTFEVGDETLELETGDCCIVRQDTHFSYRNTSTATARTLIMHTPRYDDEAERFEE
jgi:mannose-6-phosphate isomerase-like protein (cupin superfamily)